MRWRRWAADAGRDLARFQWAHLASICIADTREEAARIAAERLAAPVGKEDAAARAGQAGTI